MVLKLREYVVSPTNENVFHRWDQKDWVPSELLHNMR
jgi:hypothetical protein